MEQALAAGAAGGAGGAGADAAVVAVVGLDVISGLSGCSIVYVGAMQSLQVVLMLAVVFCIVSSLGTSRLLGPVVLSCTNLYDTHVVSLLWL